MTLWKRLAYLFPWRRRAADRDMQEELRSIAAMAEPGELGNLTLAAEDARAEWGWTWLERVGQDVRYASRILRNSPAFAATAVLSLALGIGANSAIFAALDAAFWKPLPRRRRPVLGQLLHHAGPGWRRNGSARRARPPFAARQIEEAQPHPGERASGR